MFKRLLLAVIFMFMSTYVLASPAQQEKQERCKFEAMVTQMGFQARLSMDKEEFDRKVEELRASAANDPDVSKEQLDTAVRALKQGYAGVSPQKAFDACMRQKQT